MTGNGCSMRSWLAIALLGVAGAGWAADVTVGEPAPDFVLMSRTGDNLRLSEYRGKVVMLNFWATWCGPCRQEMPLLDSLYQRYQPAGFELLGVNIDTDYEKARDMAVALGISFPILYDEEHTVAKRYDVSAMPLTIIVDRHGIVRYVHEGFERGAADAYLDNIRSVLKE